MMMSPNVCRRVVGLAVLLAASAGCSSYSNPVSPTAAASPSASPSTPSPTQIRLIGFVTDSAFRPLDGATIEVVDGPQAGMSTTADASGQVTLIGEFNSSTIFRASAAGHVTATQPWSCSVTVCGAGTGAARPYLAFYLAPLVPPTNIAGDYILTFVADPACTAVPTELRRRTYSAGIFPAVRRNEPAGSSFVLKLSGGSFVGTLDNFSIGVAGDYADFFLDNGHDAPVVEQLPTNSYLAFSGNAAGSVTTAPGSSISLPFSGWIEYCDSNAPMGSFYRCDGAAHCESNSHQLILTRR